MSIEVNLSSYDSIQNNGQLAFETRLDQLEEVLNAKLPSQSPLNEAIRKFKEDIVENVHIKGPTTREKSNILFNAQDSFNYLRNGIATELKAILSQLNSEQPSKFVDSIKSSFEKINEYSKLSLADLKVLEECMEGSKTSSKKRAKEYVSQHEKIADFISELQNELEVKLQNEITYKAYKENGNIVEINPQILLVNGASLASTYIFENNTFSSFQGYVTETQGSQVVKAEDSIKVAATKEPNQTDAEEENSQDTSEELSKEQVAGAATATEGKDEELAAEESRPSPELQAMQEESPSDVIVEKSKEETPELGDEQTTTEETVPLATEEGQAEKVKAEKQAASEIEHKEAAFEQMAEVPQVGRETSGGSVLDEEPSSSAGIATVSTATETSGINLAEETMVGTRTSDVDTKVDMPTRELVSSMQANEENISARDKVYSGKEIVAKVGLKALFELQEKNKVLKKIATELKALQESIRKYDTKGVISKLFSRKGSLENNIAKERYTVLKDRYDIVLGDRKAMEIDIKSKFSGYRFTREGAPGILSLVSIPTEKFNALPSVADIRMALAVPLEEGRIIVRRQGEKLPEGGYKPDDELELVPHRNGKFKLYLNGKKISDINTAFADDALQIAHKFKKGDPGTPIRFVKKKFEEYTIIPNGFYPYE